MEIQKGVKLLKKAILDGTYFYEGFKPEENATPAEREALFLKHFKANIERYFKRLLEEEVKSLDNLSYPKSALLFGIHARNVSALSTSVEAAKLLQTHNVSHETILPGGESISGNLGFTIFTLKKCGSKSFNDIGLSSEPTLTAALSFNPDIAKYTTHYGTCLRTYLIRSNDDAIFPQGEDFIIENAPAATRNTAEILNSQQVVGAIVEIALEGTDGREREMLKRLFRLVDAHFQGDLTYEKLGEVEGVTKQRIEQLVKRGLFALREASIIFEMREREKERKF